MLPPFCPPEQFETANILARPLNETDASGLFENLLGDPKVTWHLSEATHLSVEQTKFYIHCWNIARQCRLYYIWGLEDKKTEQIIGLIDIRPAPPRVEVGIATAQRPGAKRYRAVSEVVLKMLDWLAAQPTIHRIHVCCDANGGGARFFRHFGFRFEASLSAWEERPNQNNPAGDVDMYALTRPFESLANAFCAKLRERMNITKFPMYKEALQPLC